MLQQHSMSGPQCCPIYGWLGIVLSVGASTDIVGTTVWRLVSVCSAIYRLEAPTAISAGHPPHTVAIGCHWVAHTLCCRWHFHLPLCLLHSVLLCESLGWHILPATGPYSARVKLLPIPNFGQICPQNSAEIHICQMSPNAEFITSALHFNEKTKTQLLFSDFMCDFMFNNCPKNIIVHLIWGSYALNCESQLGRMKTALLLSFQAWFLQP